MEGSLVCFYQTFSSGYLYKDILVEHYIDFRKVDHALKYLPHKYMEMISLYFFMV